MPAEITEKSADHNDLKTKLLADIAVQKITAVPPVKAGGCSLYEVGLGWEIEALQNNKAVRVVNSMAALSQALSDGEGAPNIIISRQAGIPSGIAQDMCRRQGQGQTIFIEVEDNE